MITAAAAPCTTLVAISAPTGYSRSALRPDEIKTGGLQPVGHGRQVAVEDEHVVVGIRRALQCCSAVVHHIAGAPGVAQTLADPLGQPNVILHDPHPRSVRLAG